MKRILITRPRAQADPFAAALQASGFEPFFFPVIEIRPMDDYTVLDRALQKIACYDWLVFTSINGVDIVWQRMSSLLIDQIPESVKVAAIGPKTAQALQKRGANPSFVPDEYIAEAILPGLGDLRGKWVLLPRAEIARKALPEAIEQSGGIAHEIAVYRTLPVEPDETGLSALRDGVDAITLTSPSTVQNCIAITGKAALNPQCLPGDPFFACIGPITAKAAREEGLSKVVVANEYTTEGLIKVISDL